MSTEAQLEFWTSTVAAPRRSAAVAQRIEELGFDGMMVVDSQNLSGDPYVSLAMAATTTSSLRLETSVTNPVTRHAAATATAALSVQKVSEGRMVVGIGRGDSALAHLGHAPARVAWFEQYLKNLQAYLRGDEVPFSASGINNDVAPPLDTLGLADAPAASAISWTAGRPMWPVETAATGPKVIAASARHVDRILFALGAEPDRIAWGIETATTAALEAGRDMATLEFGAYVNVVCHDDIAIARRLAEATTGLFARFSVMHGDVSGPADDDATAEVLRNVHERYDMNAHGQHGGDQTTALTDDFIDQFAIVGDVEHCVTRLQALADLGVTKFAITGTNPIARSSQGKEATANFVDRVLPALRL